MTLPSIAFVAPVLGTGRPSGQILDLACGLARAGARVVVFAEEGRLAHEFQRRGIPVELAPLPRRPLLDRRRIKAAREALIRHTGAGALIVHGHGSDAAAAAALLARSTKAELALTFYDRADARAAPHLSGARLHAVFVHSAPAQEELVNHRGVPRELVQLVPAGLDLERVGPVARPPWPAMPVIGALGRLEPLGGQETLLRAAAELRRASRAGTAPLDFKLLVVGEGPEKRRLLNLSRELGLAESAVFAGDLPGRAEVFETIDIFVAPTLRDGFSHDLLEAMARGIPVIATAAGAVFEQVQDGRTGLLAPPQDAPALAAALARYLGDPASAREIGHRAAAEVIDRFPIQRLVDALAERYERVAP